MTSRPESIISAWEITEAIDNKWPITLIYLKKGSNGMRQVRRTIEPYTLIKSQAGNHLVLAGDRTRRDIRSFRTDRVLQYKVHRYGRFTLEKL